MRLIFPPQYDNINFNNYPYVRLFAVLRTAKARSRKKNKE